MTDYRTLVERFPEEKARCRECQRPIYNGLANTRNPICPFCQHDQDVREMETHAAQHQATMKALDTRPTSDEIASQDAEIAELYRRMDAPTPINRSEDTEDTSTSRRDFEQRIYREEDARDGDIDYPALERDMWTDAGEDSPEFTYEDDDDYSDYAGEGEA